MKNFKFLKSVIYSSLLVFGIWSCSEGGPKKFSDTPTSGSVNIVVDESYTLLFDSQIYTFQRLYPKAKIKSSFSPEKEALQALMNDCCKVIVINRDLNENERAEFKKNNLFPKSTKIAEDAIALVVHNENTVRMLSLDQIKQILLGKDSVWKQLSSEAPNETINVVFDNAGSANERYLKEVLLEKQAYQKNCFAVKSNPEVIKYVSEHKQSLGIISVNWISDQDDTLSQRFLEEVKVIAISKSPNHDYFKPYQAYIKTKDYPLCRDVYMINRQTRSGLGMGFVSFVAGEKGQRMILKTGLVPATIPSRIVEIKH
jgi:phosphate transport system substrate-binding protein